ncbi:MAG: hypothetical protein JSW34_06160 [Candidatus Zixiibacteriota bacterium]|nr:MAG: hypothetical protein JSW34_06160 [candidate division Zixibacteria bacterium]
MFRGVLRLPVCRSRPGLCLIALFLVSLLAGPAQSNDLVRYALCDVRVLYLFDDARSIDWPTLYYLNDQFGCRLDLLTVGGVSGADVTSLDVPDREIYLHTVSRSLDDSASVAAALGELFRDRRPDIVILAAGGDGLIGLLRDGLLHLAQPGPRLFNILKVYQRLDMTEVSESVRDAVVLNSRELLTRYRERMQLEIPVLFPRFEIAGYSSRHLVHYRLLQSNLVEQTYEDNFLTGINFLRLISITDSLFTAGPMKVTILRQARKFVSYFNASRISIGARQVGFILDGYRELRNLNQHEQAALEIPDYNAYLRHLLYKAERAALDAVGISWDGKIILRDSPHGPRLKFLASLSAGGPQAIELNSIKFHPYWDSTVVALDVPPRVIAPHQTFTREILVDIDDRYLNSQTPDSLKFTVEVAYGQIPLVFTSLLAVWQVPDLDVRFEPPYYFVKPFPDLEIDRVVSNLNLNAVITKPYDYSGTVQLNLQTPRGLFAGAYRKEVTLEPGGITETVRIPFTISNLFELGVQQQVIELKVDNKPVAGDTSRIRIASCEVADTVKIGFLPDSLGMLEDILRMTEATYRPLTDRSLVTGDLEAYNVIVIGSGAFRDYDSFHLMKNRFETYLRQGGSLVILGQPEDWPGDAVPFSFVATTEVVTTDELTSLIPEARILARPYTISQKNLLSSFYRRQVVSAAVITPAEKVIVTSRGGTLLSVSRLGDGQMIFCGLPLAEMIARLDIDAIHLFANILNY